MMMPNQADTLAMDRCVYAATKLMLQVAPTTPTATLKINLGILSYIDRADILKLRWRIRLAARPATSLQRILWYAFGQAEMEHRPTLVRYLDNVVDTLGLREALVRLEAGDHSVLAALLAKASTAIFQRRWQRLRTEARASPKLQERLTRIMDQGELARDGGVPA